MLDEVLWGPRSATSGDVLRTGKYDSSNLSYASHYEACLGKRANPDSDIDILTNQINIVIVQDQLNANSWMRIEKARDGRDDVPSTEQAWCGDAQETAQWRVARLFDIIDCIAVIAQDLASSFGEAATCRCWC